MAKLSKKSKEFNSVLLSAKHALDSADIPFHLHSGTALGAHREHDFIAHDDDIDLAVFHRDVNKPAQVKRLIKAMEDNGFGVDDKLGTLRRGYELKFYDKKTDIPLDIFWVYEGNYRGKNYHILSSYYGECDKYTNKACVWAYHPYKTIRMKFLGHTYNVMPQKTLVDAYGKDWKKPKKFSYHEGLKSGYKSKLTDYYEHTDKKHGFLRKEKKGEEMMDETKETREKKSKKKVAFCFLLYNNVKHPEVWRKFFDEDAKNSHSIYAHIKKVTRQTEPWLVENRISSIRTGWCSDNLVHAWVNMLKEALKDKSNMYFVLLSDECIPLYGYNETYKKITSSKSRFNIDMNAEPAIETGLVYADQWVLLARKHAEMLVKMDTTKEGKEFIKRTKKQKTPDFCADELYPVNWFVEKYGKHTSPSFKKEFSKARTTYTRWEGGESPHPIKFTLKKMRSHRRSICNSGAIFARKFEPDAAGELAETCGNRNTKNTKNKKSMRTSKQK